MSLFESSDTFFVELLLPVPIAKLFTYRVPQIFQDKIQVGQRVIVQFGERKVLTGIIADIHTRPPKEYEAKYILELLDEAPVVTPLQLKFFQWLADYYCCTPGEVLNAGLPAGLKLSSESMVQLHPAFDWNETAFDFSEKEEILLKRLAQESLGYSDIAQLLGVKTIYSIIKSLTKKEAILLFEDVKDKYKPKAERRIRLSDTFLDTFSLEKLFEQLSSKPKQEEVLLKYLQLIPVLQHPELNKGGIKRAELLKNDLSESSLNTLIKNEILQELEVIVSRFATEEKIPDNTIQLSEEQLEVQNQIISSFETQSTVLLHGITGSGKTEIYISLILKALEGGSQVLLLLPEIALTTQIVQRLKRVFGAAMGIYHSRFTDNERVEVWNGILNGQFKFIVGVRSSIFLPFENLGLIIVDEEHDTSYKQQEPAPRYHARDSALMLSQLHHAKVLLGSATPSIESYYQTQQQKFGLVTLTKRYANAQLPTISIANLRIEQIQKTNKGEFSSLLLRKIEDALSKKEQVIIFQNRRGYSPTISCEDCSWVPKCVNCAVSLTYHQFRNALVCHYCGYKESLPQQCPTCTSTRIKTVGYGTEKLEEELKVHFPDAVVQRMDLDTTRSKSSYESIIDQFEKGETNILVGTQMVTKGLDFNNVNLVGIFNADRMLHFPDFRSYERAYQLITQVSGRAGRREKQGEVVIQTTQPDHPVLEFVNANNYRQFYQAEINERHQHAYPPFTRLVEVTIKHVDKKVCRKASELYAKKIREALPEVRVLGPGEPMISKIRNQYLMSILIKITRGKSDLAAIKRTLMNEAYRLVKDKELRSVRVIVDVDPC
jgi:primosomal protein N' (replication factor Y) (superfamily II helicase)